MTVIQKARTEYTDIRYICMAMKDDISEVLRGPTRLPLTEVVLGGEDGEVGMRLTVQASQLL